jgi:hypothetical protein
MKIISIEDAVRSGPFRRFSRFRQALLAELYGEQFKSEPSNHSDQDLIQKLIDNGDTFETLQGYLNLLLNPALKYIEYKEFIIGPYDQAGVDELKAMVAPYLNHKGTLIEPIEFKGKTPIKYRVVAYDDLIDQLKARYSTVTVAVGP